MYCLTWPALKRDEKLKTLNIFANITTGGAFKVPNADERL